MCSGAIFLIGLFLLFRGEFRYANRTIRREQARIIAFLLMVPFLFGVCAGMVIGLNSEPATTMEGLLDSAGNLFLIEVVMLLGVIGAVAYWIYQQPVTAPNLSSTSVMPDSGKAVLTPEEAAVYLRVTPAEVHALIEDGRLPAARIGGEYRIARRAVDDFLSSRADDPFEGI